MVRLIWVQAEAVLAKPLVRLYVRFRTLEYEVSLIKLNPKLALLKLQFELEVTVVETELEFSVRVEGNVIVIRSDCAIFEVRVVVAVKVTRTPTIAEVDEEKVDV